MKRAALAVGLIAILAAAAYALRPAAAPDVPNAPAVAERAARGERSFALPVGEAGEARAPRRAPVTDADKEKRAKRRARRQARRAGSPTEGSTPGVAGSTAQATRIGAAAAPLLSSARVAPSAISADRQVTASPRGDGKRKRKATAE